MHGMVWVDVIEPGADEVWPVRRMMLASGMGWSDAGRDGCEYVLARGDERVYALRSGFVAYSSDREDWIDPILDAYGEGWRERRNVDGASEKACCAAIRGIVLDRVGRHPRPVPVAHETDASDIDRFDRLNERWIGTIDDLMGSCDGRSRDEALDRAIGEYEMLRARLVSAHETVNRRTLYRLQVLGGIMAASGVGQFVISLGDPSFPAWCRICGVVSAMIVAAAVAIASRRYRD